MIEVCLLGSGGMMPLPDRPLSATAFRIDGEVILFDCGEGTQVSWRASGFSYRALGTILISHAHADHIAGLPGVLFQIAHATREEPVRIIGPAGIQPVIDGLLTVVGGLPFDLHLQTLEDGESVPLVGRAILTAIGLRHRRACLGYVIDLPRAPEFLPERARELGVPLDYWRPLQEGMPVGGFQPGDVTGPPRKGLRLALLTDTTTFPELADQVRGSDLLVTESTFVLDEDEQRADERGHMTMRQAAELARDANVQRLWLTHFSPKVQNPEDYAADARALFPGAEIGYSGLSTELSFV
jgi:ribonuclease Z